MAVSDKEFDELKKELEELKKKLRAKGNQSLNDEETKAEKTFEKIDKFVTTLTNTFKNFTNWIGSAWGEADDAASKYAKTIGMSAKGMQTLRKNTIDFVADNSIGAKFNTSMKELLQLQMSYNTQLGRSVQMTNEQLSNLAAMKSIIGEEQTIKFTANFERFGLDANAAASTFAEMFNNATKKGISLEKYSKNFLDNIDLAQRYTFQNGIEGLRKMAEKATSIRMDLQQTASFAEKVNTVEGSIKTGAKLSVLGGPFAQFSNPLGMLYESLNDLEGLQNRLTNMTSGFAKWNSETNQVEVSAFNRMRLKAMAEATGQDYGKLMDMVFAQGRRKEVEKQFVARGLSDEVREYALNVAQIDKKTGKAYVTIDGEKKDINSITNADLKALQATNKTQAEDVKDIATMLRSMTDVREGADKQYNALKAQHQERMGWGQTLKGIYSLVGKSNFFLKGILSATMAMAMVNTGGTFFGSRGFFPLNGRGSGPTGGGGGGATPSNTIVNSSVSAPMMPMMMGGVAGGATGGSAGAVGGAAPFYRDMSKIDINGRYKTYSYQNKAWGVINNPSLTDAQVKAELSKIKRNETAFLKRHPDTPRILKDPSKTASALKAAEIRKNHPWATKFRDFRAKGGIGGAISRSFSPVGGMIGSMAGSAISMGLHSLAGNEIGGASSWLRAGADVAQYAGMGAMFGPWGALAGAVIGGLIGGVRETRAVAKQNHLRDLAAKGIYLNGDYGPMELRNIKEGPSAISINSKLYNKLKANGDLAAAGFYGGVIMANGGIITDLKNGGIAQGKSHVEGGIKVKGSQIEVEGGEAVINKNATERNTGVINAMNNGATIKPIKTLSATEISRGSNINNIYQGPSKLDISPLNIGGTIKLDLGNQRANIDSKELMNNPEFVRSMTDVITKQINLVDNKRFSRDSYFRKM